MTLLHPGIYFDAIVALDISLLGGRLNRRLSDWLVVSIMVAHRTVIGRRGLGVRVYIVDVLISAPKATG